MELHNIKQYIDNDCILNTWVTSDIESYKKKAVEYGNIVGRFISCIKDSNFIGLYEQVIGDYVSTFWKLINQLNAFKRISPEILKTILQDDPHTIHEILKHYGLVNHFDSIITEHLLTYPISAEILLSKYEQEDSFSTEKCYIPRSLTLENKESIISNYLDSESVNYNYIGLVLKVRNNCDFGISDKIRLKAKRIHSTKTEEFFNDTAAPVYKNAVRVTFVDNHNKVKDFSFDADLVANFTYDLSSIKQNSATYLIFQNFNYLFEYLDEQSRISLFSKRNQIGSFEKLFSVRSQNEYPQGIAFRFAEMVSHLQIIAYENVIKDNLNNSLENVLHNIFTTIFQEQLGFADNARLSTPTETNSYLEKVRLLAPELESILKQYKLFVDDGHIDFELLQISSLPISIKDIPSLNKDKYFYLNNSNKELNNCVNLFFSDQTLLSYVKPFREKPYRTFFNLITHEQVQFSNYEDFQKPQLNYLIEMGHIVVDEQDFIQVTNLNRLMVLKDLNDNEFASFHHYPTELQQEVKRMADENLVCFGNSLLSKPEQAYFNYFLNKSEFTNGLDLRNSYLHGTQANPDDLQSHERAYFTYLKLLVLIMLKIDDDLRIKSALTRASLS